MDYSCPVLSDPQIVIYPPSKCGTPLVVNFGENSSLQAGRRDSVEAIFGQDSADRKKPLTRNRTSWNCQDVGSNWRQWGLKTTRFAILEHPKIHWIKLSSLVISPKGLPHCPEVVVHHGVEGLCASNQGCLFLQTRKTVEKAESGTTWLLADNLQRVSSTSAGAGSGAGGCAGAGGWNRLSTAAVTVSRLWRGTRIGRPHSSTHSTQRKKIIAGW